VDALSERDMRGEEREDKRERRRREEETYSISAFHSPDKDSRVAGVDAEGFVEEVGEVFCCYCV
jgi:hypothetical protein